jgi:hypothetical protein
MGLRAALLLICVAAVQPKELNWGSPAVIKSALDSVRSELRAVKASHGLADVAVPVVSDFYFAHSKKVDPAAVKKAFQVRRACARVSASSCLVLSNTRRLDAMVCVSVIMLYKTWSRRGLLLA